MKMTAQRKTAGWQAGGKGSNDRKVWTNVSRF